MIHALYRFLALAAIGAALLLAEAAQTVSPKIGFVVMHGKGGSPSGPVSDLVSFLAGKGYLVANLEMPWSGRREYDVTVAAAEKEVESALDALRSRGAQKLFVAGHSQGGLFALYFGGKHPVDGVIAIAPGGSAAGPLFREKLGEPVTLARSLVAEGKGDEKVRLLDYENARGAYTVVVAPAIYLTWFDPEGAMNQAAAVKSMLPQVPVLFIVPRNDYPGLARAKRQMFDALPRNPLTKLYEPDSDHRGAPFASRDEIVQWSAQVASPPTGQGNR